MELQAALARWNALPRRVRATLGIVGAAAVLASILFSAIAHPRESAIFAAPLHPEQLSEVEERLASWNVPFTPTADNVMVDAKQRDALLLRLSLAGVPHEHVESSGDLLGKLGALTPQSVIDAQTRDGLAGDIELALRGIDGVQDARVIVAPAKPGYFADDSSQEATASVRLRLTPGARLSPAAIAGVRGFVAAGVPGLDAQHVTIVDDRGIALGSAEDGGDGDDLQRSLQSALDAAFGEGVAVVRVRVEYDPVETRTSDVRRTPAADLPIAASAQTERYDERGKRYGRWERRVDRGSDVRETTATARAGRIARISAAVFVDAAANVDLDRVRSLASAALGLDARRGDTLAVSGVAFSHVRAPRKDAWWLAYGAIVPLLPTLVVAIAGLVALRWSRAPLTALLRGIVRRAGIARAAGAVRGIPPANVRGVLANEPPHAAAAIISALPAATAAAVLDMYPEHERAAIVRRMQRPASPLFDAEEYIANA